MKARLDLQGWVERIKDQDMPVFGRTVQIVRAVTADENASAAALAQGILQDAALTTKVLKLANSVLFNPSRQPINTVSRAIVLLGFNVVGDLVLSIHLIDALLSGGLRERVAADMARCFHAAVQARTAAMLRGAQDAEEVFVAALLGRVGEMAFWCFGGAAARELDQAMNDDPDSRPEDLQRDILGFSLRSLSLELTRAWRLGPLVEGALAPGNNPDTSEAAIGLGYRLAAAVEQGWESPQALAALAQYAEFVGQPAADVAAAVSANATDAARVAAQFGAEDAARLIPIPPKGLGVDIQAEAADPGPDSLLQLRILRDLSALVAGRPSLNDVLQLVLEGIYRGLGMGRAVFALQSADRLQVVGKAALGRGAETLVRRFAFALDGMPGDIINEVFEQRRNVWLKPAMVDRVKPERLVRVTGCEEGFLAPIVTSGRVIGVFYADRSGLALDEEGWQGFQHFVQQAGLCFEHVAGKGKRQQ
ncbi:HDOD domain-containing protein [Uliginosibacterium sp. H1]|uniref:HDOD domain-containing protein n=1 Tax=Uliginosibacterium sp. H1 TaxID=3114757 RepID=UPI002E18BA01|nr:HDOD domain-containing protein [Uliginosibacterium sp. H1]